MVWCSFTVILREIIAKGLNLIQGMSVLFVDVKRDGKESKV